MEEKDLTQDMPQDNTTGQEDMGINTDENITGTLNVEEKVGEASELEKLRETIREKEDKYLRLYAEFDNFRRRNAKERIELIQTAGKEVIVSLLEVMDDCDRAEKVMIKSDDIAAVREGVQLVFNKFRRTMLSKGLKEMECVGTEFNADVHEAITEVPAGPDNAGKVIDQVEKGYYLNDKIIRFAKVVVGQQA
jgi:molecular chaperone GrpE